tara:strand:- start:1952 stop:2605 length:654 start_codon:yes stop_codon:yes gene_type:complete
MITAVVAVREGSQRCKNKNNRPFGDTNLLQMKLELLKKVKNLDEIIVNSESEEMLQVGLDNGVKIHKRDPYYASSKINNSEMHGHMADTTKTDTIFLAPVCSPFVSVSSHEKAIDFFLKNKFDSVTSVTEVKNHLWLDGKPLNYTLDNVPNSQDLPDVVKLNYGITIIDREVMKRKRAVIGDKPGFYKLNEIESIDVDTEFDWLVAERIYEHMKKNA